MMRIRILIILLILPWLAQGQHDPLQAPNTFRSDANPNYWKNKKPHAAYWQQDVYYQIDASLDDQSDVIQGTLVLEYVNNSPDDLHELYFHLYQNAFQPNSYAAEYHNRKSSSTDSVYQGTEVSDLTVNSQSMEWEVDNTILKVHLKDPIRPGDKAVIECRFQTQFGPIHGRMKRYQQFGYKHYNVVHWYPRISVYDRKFGWTTDQHLGHEFYGDFGAFDVSLSLPEQYVLDGTGFLLNRDQVLPEDLMTKLDIKNFADKPWNEAPSQIIPPTDKRKTWRFHAENVHDFAWTADPTYRIGKSSVTLQNGHEVTTYALAQEQHASGWQNAAEYAAKVIEVYSNDFGPYAYHKMIVADARDGMEYPMLTLDGGRDPSYRGLLAHEIGHNWFFGMVGNNETYRASLDEGFTQFLTAWALQNLEGDSVGVGTSVLGMKKPFAEMKHVRDYNVYDGFYMSTIIADNTPALNVHSDGFDNNYQYGQVYYKTATMLYNLQYVLGDQLFQEAIQHYFNQWKFCHPYLEDFRNSIIQYTKVDLNWFFDEWLETEKKIDYSVDKVRWKKGGIYEVTIKRNGMQMPLDIAAYSKSGEVLKYHIPNTYFEKETDATILPKWYGWGDFNDTYTFEIEADSPVKEVVIDPTKRLADVYQLNNSSAKRIEFQTNDFQWNRPKQVYEVEMAPVLWYNGYDGLKVGLDFRSHYAHTFHKIKGRVWFNTGAAQQLNYYSSDIKYQFDRFNYVLSYSQPLRTIGRDLNFNADSKWLEGLVANKIGISKSLPNNKTKVGWSIGQVYRAKKSDVAYLIYVSEWNADRLNSFTEGRLEHGYRYGRSNGLITSVLRSPFFLSDYNYGYLNLESVNNNRVAFMNFRTRVFAQFGAGTSWAPESKLFAAGANPEQMMDQPLERSVGYVPQHWYGYDGAVGQFQSGGGLNLRGYNNYLLPEYNGDSLVRLAYSSHSGAAFNFEWNFGDLMQLNRNVGRTFSLDVYSFSDIGVININRTNESIEWSSLRMDSGLGTALKIKRWGKYSDLKPVTVRADFPIFLNRPPADQEYLAFRWLIGFSRAF